MDTRKIDKFNKRQAQLVEYEAALTLLAIENEQLKDALRKISELRGHRRGIAPEMASDALQLIEKGEYNDETMPRLS